MQYETIMTQIISMIKIKLVYSKFNNICYNKIIFIIT